MQRTGPGDSEPKITHIQDEYQSQAGSYKASLLLARKKSQEGSPIKEHLELPNNTVQRHQHEG